MKMNIIRPYTVIFPVKQPGTIAIPSFGIFNANSKSIMVEVYELKWVS